MGDSFRMLAEKFEWTFQIEKEILKVENFQPKQSKGAQNFWARSAIRKRFSVPFLLLLLSKSITWLTRWMSFDEYSFR